MVDILCNPSFSDLFWNVSHNRYFTIKAVFTSTDEAIYTWGECCIERAKLFRSYARGTINYIIFSDMLEDLSKVEMLITSAEVEK